MGLSSFQSIWSEMMLLRYLYVARRALSTRDTREAIKFKTEWTKAVERNTQNASSIVSVTFVVRDAIKKWKKWMRVLYL
jgi:hypothetical protein